MGSDPFDKWWGNFPSKHSSQIGVWDKVRSRFVRFPCWGSTSHFLSLFHPLSPIHAQVDFQCNFAHLLPLHFIPLAISWQAASVNNDVILKGNDTAMQSNERKQFLSLFTHLPIDWIHHVKNTGISPWEADICSYCVVVLLRWLTKKV